MKHVLLIVACAALMVGLTFAPRPLAMAEPPKGVARWEYATLDQFYNPDDKTTTTAFVSRDMRIEGSMRQVAAKFGGFNPLDQKTSVTAVINVLGDQGWELVTIEGGTSGPMYVFKRPKL